MSKTILSGVWRLVQYTTVVEGTNETTSLFGGKAVGYLIYTPEGFMSVHIMPTNRSHSDSKLQEKIESAENYGGYVGRYEIDHDIVTHYPEICNVLSYIQIPQVRKYKIIDDRLYLEYDHPLEEYTLLPEKKVMAHSTVIWQRVC